MYVVIGWRGTNPKVKALPALLLNSNISDFVGSSFEGYVIGNANGLDEIEKRCWGAGKSTIVILIHFKNSEQNKFDKPFVMRIQ